MPATVPTTLRHNLTSAYLDAARHLAPTTRKRRIAAYVESYDDVAFWRTLLSEFEDDTCTFQVMLPSATSLAKGKKTVLMNSLNTDELGRSLIACVDSDYDFLLQGATEVSRKLNNNPYIFQTYGYAIESFQCYAESLHEVCVQATLNDRVIIDFPLFMRQYSRIVYPLFLWNLWFYRNRDTNTFPMHVFNAAARLHEVDVDRPQNTLRRLQRTIGAKLQEMRARYPRLRHDVALLGPRLELLGLTPDTAYLYLQGHHVMDNVVLKLLVPVCARLRRERERDIRRLSLHNRQFRNELTSYENSQANVALMLKKNDGYKSLYLYRWLREDVRRFLSDSLPEGREKNTGSCPLSGSAM